MDRCMGGSAGGLSGHNESDGGAQHNSPATNQDSTANPHAGAAESHTRTTNQGDPTDQHTRTADGDPEHGSGDG